MNFIYGDERIYEKRLFLIFTFFFACVMAFAIIPLNFLESFSPLYQVLGVAMFIGCAVFYSMAKYGKIYNTFCYFMIQMTLSFITWFVNGGHNGEVNIFILTIFLSGVLILRHMQLMVFVIYGMLGTAVIFLLEYLYPGLAQYQTVAYRQWMDTFFGSVMCFIGFYMVFSFFINNYLFERSIIKHDMNTLSKTSSIDDLTRLFNRRHFNTFLKEAFKDMRYKKSDASLIMFDIDHFKKVNDTYGHNTGDDVLKSISKIAKSTTRTTDVLARWGGEEFILFLPNTSKKAAAMLAEKIRSNIESTTHANLHITISVGYTEWSPIDTMISFISRADSNLYEAKTSGRNQTNGSR